MLTRTRVENDQLGCFVIQKAAIPKNGVEFCQKFIGVIRCSLATSYNDVRRCLNFSVRGRQTDKRTNKATYRGGAHLKMIVRIQKFICSIIQKPPKPRPRSISLCLIFHHHQFCSYIVGTHHAWGILDNRKVLEREYFII